MTPDERETAKRLFWEKIILALLRDMRPVNYSITYAAEMADAVVEEWQKRFVENGK